MSINFQVTKKAKAKLGHQALPTKRRTLSTNDNTRTMNAPRCIIKPRSLRTSSRSLRMAARASALEEADVEIPEPISHSTKIKPVVAQPVKLKRRPAPTSIAVAAKTKKRKTVESRPMLPVQVCDPTPKDESVDDIFEKNAPPSEERTWTDKARAMVAPEPTLLLPMKLERVYDAFCALETVISVRPRQSHFSLEELKGPVEAVCERYFGQKQLGQIAEVFPEAFNIAQLEGSYSDSKVRVKPSKFGSTDSQQDRVDRLSQKEVMCRRKIMRDRLLARVHKAHEAFLEQIKCPIQFDRRTMRSWHHRFKLDQLPDIPAVDFALEHTTGPVQLSALERLQRAVADTDKRREEKRGELEAAAAQAPTPAKRTLSKNLRFLSPALLNKVMQNEKQRQSERLELEAKQEAKLMSLSRLPGLATTVRTFFVKNRRSACPLALALSALSKANARYRDTDRVHEELKMLAALVPSFCQLKQIGIVGSERFILRVDKNYKLSMVNKAIESAKTRAKAAIKLKLSGQAPELSASSSSSSPSLSPLSSLSASSSSSSSASSFSRCSRSTAASALIKAAAALKQTETMSKGVGIRADSVPEPIIKPSMRTTPPMTVKTSVSINDANTLWNSPPSTPNTRRQAQRGSTNTDRTRKGKRMPGKIAPTVLSFR